MTWFMNLKARIWGHLDGSEAKMTRDKPKLRRRHAINISIEEQLSLFFPCSFLRKPKQKNLSLPFKEKQDQRDMILLRSNCDG